MFLLGLRSPLVEQQLATTKPALRPAKRCPVQRPEITSFDVLAMLTDDKLEAKLEQLVTDINTVTSSGFDPIAWEVEACYVQRELGIRDRQYIAHEEYMQVRRDRSWSSDEPTPACEFPPSWYSFKDSVTKRTVSVR